MTLWTVALWAPLSVGFSRQEYWSGFPCPLPGDLPHPGSEPASPAAPALQVGSLLLSHRGNSKHVVEESDTVSTYGSAGQESTCNAGDVGSIPRSGQCPGEGHGTHSSILAWRIPMDRGAWWASPWGCKRLRHDWASGDAHSCMVNNNEFKRNERIRSYALQQACENKIRRYRWMLE